MTELRRGQLGFFLSDPLDRLFESSPPFCTCQTDGIIVPSLERAVAERWVRQGGGGGGGEGREGHLLVALCFHTLELTGALLLLGGGCFGGSGLMRGGMEGGERWGVGGQGYDVTAKVTTGGKHRNGSTFFFLKLWTAKS